MLKKRRVPPVKEKCCGRLGESADAWMCRYANEKMCECWNN